MVPPVGFEPTIPGLKVRCLTSLATGAKKMKKYGGVAMVAGTGVDPVTSRFSDVCSAN